MFFEGNGTIENCRLYRDVFSDLTGVRIWYMHDTIRNGNIWLDDDVFNPAISRCELANGRGGVAELWMTNAWDPSICCSGLGEYSQVVIPWPY